MWVDTRFTLWKKHNEHHQHKFTQCAWDAIMRCRGNNSIRYVFVHFRFVAMFNHWNNYKYTHVCLAVWSMLICSSVVLVNLLHITYLFSIAKEKFDSLMMFLLVSFHLIWWSVSVSPKSNALDERIKKFYLFEWHTNSEQTNEPTTVSQHR